ncbi:FAD-binding protein [Herbaspirillum sp. NPDC101397]|uniref:FAD-binding protein n=1 Tax=Herbaspirillum sp. NPDC101397 TaxID=3364006 RepID=UPI00383BE3E9
MKKIAKDSGLALLAFKIGQHQFDINRGLTYISMRDQIIRARTLIHTAHSAEIFSQTDSSLSKEDSPPNVDVLIIGGGVGGISAALAAVELGLTTVVLEKNEVLFPLLRKGSDRLLSATVYDWPSLHFCEHNFPNISALAADSSPKEDSLSILNFPDAPISPINLAAHLDQQVAKYEKEYPNTLVINRNTAIPLESPFSWKENRKRVVVSLAEPIKLAGAVSAHNFHTRIVVFAVGFGSEKVEIDHHQVANDSFWGYESLEQDIQKYKDERICNIVIEGSGDGGLQEVLRAALLPKYHDLSLAIKLLEDEFGADLGCWHRSLIDIQCAENNAGRAYMWGYDGSEIFSRLDAVHDKVIQNLCKDHKKELQAWRRRVTRPQPNLVINLVDSHKTSARVYPLNRFLAKLLEETSDWESGVVVKRMTDSSTAGKPTFAPINRSGLEKPSDQFGTATSDDYLRRSVFRSIPNHYSVIE